MKKVILSLIILSFLIAGCRVLAEETLPDPGTTPDSTFYFLKSWKESIQTFFTFGAENKAKQFMHLAEVRLAEYQKMIEKEKIEIAEKTLTKYEQQLNHALEKAEEAKEKGKDVEKLKEAISEKIIKHQEVLIEVLNKVPEEAKKGIENAIEMSQKGFENAIQAVTGEKKEELQRKAEEVKSRIEEKIIESKPAESDATPSKPPISSEPTEIRYYTCPDGTKVESGKCYGTSETFHCSMLASPERQCPQQTSPVSRGTVCQTAGEIKYYQCADNTQIPWCMCGPESGQAGAKNAWQCQYYPVGFTCQKQTVTPTPTLPQTSFKPPMSISLDATLECKGETMEDYKCSDGTLIKWQCKCRDIGEQSEEARYCIVTPAEFCSASVSASPLAITWIMTRYIGWIGEHIFWTTNAPANSYVEYGLTTSYGFTAGFTVSPASPTTQHGTNALGEARQRNATYHFRIVAEDAQGHKIVSQDYTFTMGP